MTRLQFRRLTALACAFFLLPPAASGHHSGAVYDRNSEVSVTGTVTRYDFVNPHVHVFVEGVTDSGATEEWSFEMQSAILQIDRGWSDDSLQVGDRVVAVGNPLRSGSRNVANSVSFTLESGEVVTQTHGPGIVAASTLAARGSARDISIGATPAEGYDGIWQVAARHGISGRPVDMYEPVSPEIRAEFAMSLQSTRFVPVLNERSKEIARAFDTAAPDNPWCSPEPYLFAHHVEAYIVEIERRADQVVFRRGGEEQIVHIGGEHPPADELYTWGYATGEWDGDVLSVDIRNFEPNPWGIARGLPSGTQKRITHVFRWRDDRTALDVDTTMFDPEYMTAPFEIETSFFHKPDLELTPPIECLQEAGTAVYEAQRAGP